MINLETLEEVKKILSQFTSLVIREFTDLEAELKQLEELRKIIDGKRGELQAKEVIIAEKTKELNTLEEKEKDYWKRNEELLVKESQLKEKEAELHKINELYLERKEKFDIMQKNLDKDKARLQNLMG